MRECRKVSTEMETNMIQKNISDIVSLYELYGFEASDITEHMIIFTFSNGYFFNCEIMTDDTKSELVKKKKEEYEELGYSVRIVEFDTIDNIDNKLYCGFFNIGMSKEKRINEYQRFVKKQSVNSFDGNNKYSYVTGKYIVDNNSFDDNIVERIHKIIKMKGSHLIIVEAAAGFGKTCTSFEVMRLISEEKGIQVPIFIELSKNRNAKVFRHILLDAIDNDFSYLSSDVVRYAIKKGRIPLIIDGFDELLSKSLNDKDEKKSSDDITDAQNMLSTIAELLREDSEAKVILTSRKSSFFTGEDFEEWTLQNLEKCDVTRFMLEEPTLVNWLGKEKCSFIDKEHIPLEKFANPIILTIYRNMKMEDFAKKCKEIDKVVDEYFERIMIREQTRQSLLMDVKEQRQLFLEFAAELVDLGISVDEPKFIKEIFEMILADNITEYLHKYDSGQYNEERPNEDEFIQKLVHHAFLDRKSQNTQMIGFVNDFVFGFFIGEAFINNKIPERIIRTDYVELAATSFSTQSIQRRRKLYDKLEKYLPGIDVGERLLVDMNLLGKTNGIYKEAYVSSLTFPAYFIFSEGTLFDSICFNQCNFIQHKIYKKIFKNCQFVGCNFYDCELVGEEDEENAIQFIACNGVEEWQKAHNIQEHEEISYERIVLEQYWRPGRANADPKHTYRTLLKGLGTSEYSLVDEAIASLKRKGILFEKGAYLALDMKKINDIKTILGR